MNSTAPIKAFYGISSPWAYFGAKRLYAIADWLNTSLILKPIRVVEENGGIPLRTRPEPRQNYHAVELARWSKLLDIPLNLEPQFYPCRTIEIAAGTVIAAQRAALDARAFSFAVQRALWAENKDIANIDTLQAIALETIGAAGPALVNEPLMPEIQKDWDANLAEAKHIGIFGTPTYVYRDELFWGQDRLDFLERAIIAAQTNL